MAKLFQMAVLLALQVLWLGPLQAMPQLDLRQQGHATIDRDLRSVWQTAMVPGLGLDTAKPLDAQTVWSLSDDRFAPGKAEPVIVRNGERLVGRLAVWVQDRPHGWVLELPMPRLDVVHLSYRYNEGVWTQLTAGDQIPMARWPFASRSPAFVIPSRAGELQLIVDIPQQGLFPSPVSLWSDAAFRETHSNRDLLAGASMALAIFTMLICFGAAVIFKRFVFVAVGLYFISVALLIAAQSGMIGIYLGTNSPWFNDYIKYLTAIVFGAMLPWTVSNVVSQKYYSQFFADVAAYWMVGSLGLVIAMLFTMSRTTQWAVLTPFLIASLVFSLGIALASVVRGQSQAYWSLAAVVIICMGIVAPIAAYWSHLDGLFSHSVTRLSFLMFTTALSFLLSSALLLFALLLQYRHGNSVIARAAYSPGRDALTGLLNRDVFERMLAKTAHDIATHQSHALFVYVSVSDANTLQERFGGEGFESGMVQMAAALSSSISVMDTVARVASNAFGIVVAMPREARLANALAQKIVTRTMAISSHSAPMAHTARIALAWMPTYGQALGELEKLAKLVVQDMAEGKRIGWVGGAQTQGQSVPTADSSLLSESGKKNRVDAIHSVINRVERNWEQEKQGETSAQDAAANKQMKAAG
jgi:GGDEF domain-containing protein